ncbi:glycosyltransferase family 32 protein, partial [Lentinula novae-zelandiae]
PKIIYTLLLIAFVTLLYLLLRIYEPHIELAFYSRKFAREEILPVKPLAGCFNRPSRRYNVTERLFGARATDVHAGLEMRFGLDCYEFAGTVRSQIPTISPPSHRSRTQFHTYWRSDLALFGPRQEYMLKSFFATQNLATSKLVLWSNGDMRGNPILREYLRRYGAVEGDQGDTDGSERGSFDVRVADIALLARGTELDPEYHAHENEAESERNIFPSAHRLLLSDSKAWLDGDLIRLLLLWNFGGVWVDMDFLLTRDLEPLLEHEFVTQWDCYDKKYTPLNGALMRFHIHSPYLCEAFHIMATDSPPRPHSTDWGSTLYLKLYRRLLRGGVRPFKVLPWCFTDGRSCRLDNRLPDPFKEDQKAGISCMGLGMGTEIVYTGNPPALARALSQIFGIHLHNQWEKNFPEKGWVERLLLQRYEAVL